MNRHPHVLHYTNTSNTASILQYGLSPEHSAHGEEAVLLSKYMEDESNRKLLVGSIYLFAEDHGREISMGSRTLDRRFSIPLSELDKEKLYCANVLWSDRALESIYALEDLDEEELDTEECIRDIRSYEDSIIPYGEYVDKGLDYGKDLELLYAGAIPPEAIDGSSA